MTKSADAFRTISEVAEWLGVQTHVLRFWESKFTQVKPVKRAGGRRYYRPADMLLLGGIRKLLHEDGLTIKGVQKILREEGMAHVADMSPPLDAETDAQLDADLTARMDEDVPQPPIEAEVISFGAPPKAEPDTPPPEAASSEPEAASASPEPDAPQPMSAPGGDMAPLPSFLCTPTPPAGAPDTDGDDRQGLPYPPFVEDVPVAPPETAVEYADDPPPLLAEEQAAEPVEFAPTDTPPEPVDTHIADQAEAADTVEDGSVEPADAVPDAELPLEPTLDFDADSEVVADVAPEPAQHPDPEPSFEPVQETPVEAAPPMGAGEATDPEPGAQDDADDAPDPARTGLPSFLADYAAPAEEVPETTEAETPEAEEPVRPAAVVVVVPDDPDPDTIPVAPSALSKAARATHLNDAQRNMIRPLVAQLASLRDQMADNRRAPR
ncbi:MerR family transcriptional regulator [Tateyamaria omphalii]|uniref:HTH merR-type domain-containing protein n=1 Tax=Tateyamaria omphalii TaxID=299262 RepID=A0A1P8MU70_9RHOB|nr:MerR family transcriptional regulator [Tateyamaria omphalii]APX11646.1 hypothetical protein BWR18_08075 [Tateyamaria omphalii]